MAMGMVDCQWNFTRRTTNSAAHWMAGLRPESSFFTNFECQFPLGLKNVLLDRSFELILVVVELKKKKDVHEW